MHWTKGCRTAGLLGIILLCSASTSPLPFAVAVAQTQPSAPAADCAEQRGQTLAILTRDLIYRSHTYANAGQLNLAARSLDRALLMVPNIEDPFVRTDLVSNIAGDSGGQPSTMEQIVDQAIATQQPDIPLELLPKMVEATQTLDGEYGVINSKRAILIQLADYYRRLDQPDQARSLLDQARQILNSLEGDGFGLIAAPVAEGYAVLGDNEPAIAILDQALPLTEAMETDDSAYRADIFNAIATTYASAGAVQQALQVAERIEIPEVKARTLAVIASDAAQAGQSERARQILVQASDLAQVVPEASRSDALAQIARGYAQIGQWDTALEMADTIASTETKVRTLAELAATSDGANQPEVGAGILADLAAIAQTMTPFYDGDTLLRQIFTDYLANRQYVLAFQLSQTLDATLQDELLLKLIESASAAGEWVIAQQAAEVIPPGWENQTRYSSWRYIAAGYAQAGQYEQAIQLLDQIQDTPNYPNQVLARVAIAQSYIEDGQPDQAVEQLNQALQALEAWEEPSAKLQAMSLIAVQFAQAGRPERAVEVQRQAVDSDNTENPNGPSAAYAVEQFVAQYLKVEEYTLALQLVETMENDYEHDRALQTILNQMLEVGDLQSVVLAADGIRDPNQKVAFWVKLSDYLRGTGQPEQAAEILAQAFAIAQALEGPDENVFAEAAQVDPSVPLFDEFDRGSLIESIAIRYAELQQYDMALQTAQALRSPEYRERLIQRLACYRL